jgi:hypothetical protein
MSTTAKPTPTWRDTIKVHPAVFPPLSPGELPKRPAATEA